MDVASNTTSAVGTHQHGQNDSEAYNTLLLNDALSIKALVKIEFKLSGLPPYLPSIRILARQVARLVNYGVILYVSNNFLSRILR